MQYFKPELVFSEVGDTASDQLWGNATRDYKDRFAKLKGKIPSNIWGFLDRTNLHDFKFIRLEINQQTNRTIYPTTIELKLSGGCDISIEYRKVSLFKLSFDESDSEINWQGLDDCLYSELLDLDNNRFSHELLFASGAILYIEFESIIISFS